MDFLYWLQQLRNPILDFIFENISLLVNQTLLITGICYIYWCYNKKIGHKVFFSYCASGIFIQTIKILCKIPRPWILDSRIQPKQEMIDTATGYSFPSGHTQTATSACYSLLDSIKNKLLQIVLIISPLFMMLSRMYVGVHSPLDVSVSFLISAVIVFTVIHLLNKDYEKYLLQLCYVLFIASICSFVYAFIITNNGSCDYILVADSVKMAGATIGLALGTILETKTLNFTIKKRSLFQTIVLIIFGLIGSLAMKSGLKLILPNGIITDFIRYFFTIFWIIYLYPCIFTKLKK